MEIINLGSTLFNNYLLRFDNGAVLIDAGYNMKYDTFCEKLKEKGVDIDEIKYLVITHVHNDHISYLKELLEKTSIIPIMHFEAKERLLLGRNVLGDCSNLLSRFLSMITKASGKSDAPFDVVDVEGKANLCEGDCDCLKENGFPLSIIAFPGHTPDSIGVLTSEGYLFCGDMFINGFPALHRTTFLIESLEDYQNSWQKAINLDCKMIYPSHGKPFPPADIAKYTSKMEKIKLWRNP